MKTFRLFLVGVFALLAIAAVPMRAQAAGESVGYLSLLSHVDSNIPLRIQSQRALRRIMPQLLSLKKSGIISEFKAELQKGVLKVKYTNAAGLSALGGAQIYTQIQDAMVSVPKSQGLMQNIAKSGPKAAAIDPVFLFELYESCFEMDQLGADSHIIASLRNKAGRVMSAYEADADSTGYLSDCFPWAGSLSDVIPGYTITIKVFDISDTLLGKYQVVAPSIEFTSFNKDKSIVRGTGPANKYYQIRWFHLYLNAANSYIETGRNGKVTLGGKWGRDFGTTKFRGGDSFGMFLDQNSRFTFLRVQDIPYIYCQLGSNYCDISGIPFRPATLSILHQGTTYTFSGKFDDDGVFAVDLETYGTPILLRRGDQVSGTSVPAYSLPRLAIWYNVNSDVMHGKAPANRYFELWVNDPYLFTWYFIWGHSNSTGDFAADFSGLVDITAKQAASMEVFYEDRATGNITDFYKSMGP